MLFIIITLSEKLILKRHLNVSMGVLNTSIHVIFYYNKLTRYSVNPLIAAVDRAIGNGVAVSLVEDLSELPAKATSIRLRGEICIVAFSLLTTMLTDSNFLASLIEVIKNLKSKKCITIAGGPHATGDPLGSLELLGFDYVFIGEGEESFVEFLRTIRDEGDVKSVKGIGFIEDGKFVFTGARPRIDLDKFDPFPYWRGIFQPIEVTRGCPYGCFYCQVSYVHGFQYRHRSVERIVYYVGEFLKRGGRDVRFITPDSMSYGLEKPSRIPRVDLIEQLLDAVKTLCSKYGGRVFYGTFPSEIRPEHVTEEAMRTLSKYVSNSKVIIGAQSGSERILKLIHRGHSVEDVKNAVEVALKYSFTPDVDIIIGFPGETEEDMKYTLELADWVVRRGGRIHVHYFTPLPGSPLGALRPTPIPSTVRRQIARIIGSHKGYGNWLNQEKMAWRIVELREKGIIQTRRVMVQSARFHQLVS